VVEEIRLLKSREAKMTQRADVMQSPAYGVLLASSRRLLMFIEQEVARNGGGNVTLYADQLCVVGSVRVVRPGLRELHALGLIEWQRFPKRHVIGLSDRWRSIASAKQAMIVSGVARAQPMPPQMTPPQPATASTNA
jgi:hypothetical protein